MTPQPSEVIFRDVVERLEPVFEVSRYFGRPPGVILAGRFRPGQDAAAATSHLSPFGYYVNATPLPSGEWSLEVSPKPLTKSNRRVWLNVLLFVATIGTTLAVGTMQRGGNLKHPADWALGIPFSAALMGILLCHEMSHFTASTLQKVRATLPYFLPVPHPLLGTFGAFIRMESPIPDRRALLDIGAAGPLAGFLVAIPVTLIGLHLSPLVPKAAAAAGTIVLGDSLLFKLLTYIVKGPTGALEVQLHPLALAGWIGLWVTAVNLLPVGQLDGGHVLLRSFRQIRHLGRARGLRRAGDDGVVVERVVGVGALHSVPGPASTSRAVGRRRSAGPRAARGRLVRFPGVRRNFHSDSHQRPEIKGEAAARAV